MVILVFSFPNVMMSVGICRHNLGGSPCRGKLLLDATDAGLSSFYLCQLLDEGFLICTAVSSFWFAMFEFALQRSTNRQNKTNEKYTKRSLIVSCKNLLFHNP